MEIQVHQTLPLGRVGNPWSSHLWFGGLDFEGYQLFFFKHFEQSGLVLWNECHEFHRNIHVGLKIMCSHATFTIYLFFLCLCLSLSLSLSPSLCLLFISNFNHQTSTMKNMNRTPYCTKMAMENEPRIQDVVPIAKGCISIYIYCIFSLPKGRCSNSSCSQPVFLSQGPTNSRGYIYVPTELEGSMVPYNHPWNIGETHHPRGKKQVAMMKKCRNSLFPIQSMGRTVYLPIHE